nr:MAG TPA: P63C domain protein [Caudoviricetes sp.]
MLQGVPFPPSIRYKPDLFGYVTNNLVCGTRDTTPY